MVTDVDERGLVVKYKDGTDRADLDAVTKMWAAGVQASPLGKTLSEQTGAPLDRAGRIAVNPDLTLPGYPEVFVVGDMIDLDNLPGVAQVAIQGAKYAAKEIDGRLKGKAPQKPFKYFDKGSMATISRFRAVAMVGKLRLTGFVGLADVARGAPLLHHRLQEPGHRRAALAGLVPRPRPLRADRDRAADLRPGRAAAARARRRRPGLAARGVRRRAPSVEERRAELEARALEEARLTDAGERGVNLGERDSSSMPLLEVAAACCPPLAIASRAHRGRMNTPSASTVTPVGVRGCAPLP